MTQDCGAHLKIRNDPDCYHTNMLYGDNKLAEKHDDAFPSPGRVKKILSGSCTNTYSPIYRLCESILRHNAARQLYDGPVMHVMTLSSISRNRFVWHVKRCFFATAENRLPQKINCFKNRLLQNHRYK